MLRDRFGAGLYELRLYATNPANKKFTIRNKLRVTIAEDRIESTVEVIIERFDEDENGGLVAVGHAGHQGPDDAETFIPVEEGEVSVGDVVTAVVVDVDGVDLIAELA